MKSGLAGCALALCLSAAPALAQDTLKIGYIDPLSGGGASTGEGGLKTYLFLADQVNAAGGLNGKKIEIVPLDNKGNPQETLIQAQKAADLNLEWTEVRAPIAGRISDKKVVHKNVVSRTKSRLSSAIKSLAQAAG